MDILMLYSESLVRAREETIREIKQINELIQNEDFDQIIDQPDVTDDEHVDDREEEKPTEVKKPPLERKKSINVIPPILQRQRTLSHQNSSENTGLPINKTRRVTFRYKHKEFNKDSQVDFSFSVT